MSITSVGSSVSTASELGQASGLTGSSKMGKEEFLRLLVTQLRNQDPMNPLDGHEFAAQLAQFSSVEQLINIQESLSSNSEAVNMLAAGYQNSIAASMVGKTIEAEGNAISYAGSGNVALKVDMKSAAAEMTVTIRDASGNIVREIKRANVAGGLQEIPWDGKSGDAVALPAGRYTYQVKAADAKGAEVEARSFSKGVVDRVTFGPEGALLWIGNMSVPMSSVRSILGNGQ